MQLQRTPTRVPLMSWDYGHSTLIKSAATQSRSDGKARQRHPPLLQLPPPSDPPSGPALQYAGPHYWMTSTTTPEGFCKTQVSCSARSV
jgi:hypothetical protein